MSDGYSSAVKRVIVMVRGVIDTETYVKPLAINHTDGATMNHQLSPMNQYKNVMFVAVCEAV